MLVYVRLLVAMEILTLAVVFCLLGLSAGSQEVPSDTKAVRCSNQVKAPKKIEETIAICQDEIKLAILQEVLGELNVREAAAQLTKSQQQLADADVSAGLKSRAKRSTFDQDERSIAGCLLHCVYRKVKAVDVNGVPTLEGLVRLYTEGVYEREYFEATARGAHHCLAQERQRTVAAAVPSSGKDLCDVAYDVFECLTNHLDAYCNGA